MKITILLITLINLIACAGIAHATEETKENKIEKIKTEASKYIFKYEGFRNQAYKDHKGCSIGYGTRANSCNEYISKQEAQRRLTEVLTGLSNRINKDIPDLSINQAGALVSLAYNCEYGYNYYKKYGFKSLIDNKICMKASGKFLKGLETRRNDEYYNYLGKN